MLCRKSAERKINKPVKKSEEKAKGLGCNNFPSSFNHNSYLFNDDIFLSRFVFYFKLIVVQSTAKKNNFVRKRKKIGRIFLWFLFLSFSYNFLNGGKFCGIDSGKWGILGNSRSFQFSGDYDAKHTMEICLL